MKTFNTVLFTIMIGVLFSCNDHSSDVQQPRSAIHLDKLPVSIQSLSSRLDSFEIVHTVLAESVLDSIISGYIH